MRYPAIIVVAGLLACDPPPTPANSSAGVPAPRDTEVVYLDATKEIRPRDASTVGARRSGDSLLVELAGGKVLALVDDTLSVETWVRYSNLGPLAGTRFLGVEAGNYEGGTYRLVDRTTGHQSILDNTPLASPTGALLAVASMDMEAEYAPTRLTIYTVLADSLLQVWQTDSIAWGPDSVAWHGEDSLLVRQAFPTEEGPGSYAYRTAWVVRQGGRWQLKEPRP